MKNIRSLLLKCSRIKNTLEWNSISPKLVSLLVGVKIMDGHVEENLKPSVIATGPPGLGWNQVAKLGLSSIELMAPPPFTTEQGDAQHDAFN